MDVLRAFKKNVMKQIVLAACVWVFGTSVYAQSSYFERYIQGTGGQVTDTLDNGQVVTLDLSTDDVEQQNDEADGYFDDDLDAGWEGAPEDQNLLHLGLRFTEVQIPQGAVIDSAFVVFHAHEGRSAEDVAEITVYCEAADNAVTFDEANFNNDYLLTDRPWTSASVAWTVAEEWEIWQAYKTADLKNIVQEVVDRAGWAEGNALAFIFAATDQGTTTVDNTREFTSFENIANPDDVDAQGNPGDGTNHPERRPYLQVYFNGATGLDAVELAHVTMFPNPVQNGQLNVQFESAGTAMVSVIDLAGGMQRIYTLQGQSVTLDVSGIAAGTYLLQITQNGKTTTQHVVIH